MSIIKVNEEEKAPVASTNAAGQALGAISTVEGGLTIIVAVIFDFLVF
jgi:hypothetical protein